MERKYSVFYKYGDEANDHYLTKDEAMKLAKELEAEGYEVLVSFYTEKTNRWFNIYETR